VAGGLIDDGGARLLGFAATSRYAKEPLMSMLRRFATAASVALLLTSLAVPKACGSTIQLATPAGLNSGDAFRFVFVTSGSRNATSTSITDYNDFVQAEALGATYAGAAVTWRAIASTISVNARGNVGGFDTPVPVFRVDGTRVANDLTVNSGGLWSTFLINPISLTIDSQTISGRVWTGSDRDGLNNLGRQLGSGGSVAYGRSSSTGGSWIRDDWTSGSSLYSMYGMSSTLTVPVPEPSTYAMALAGIACGGFSMWRRRMRA